MLAPSMSRWRCWHRNLDDMSFWRNRSLSLAMLGGHVSQEMISSNWPVFFKTGDSITQLYGEYNKALSKEPNEPTFIKEFHLTYCCYPSALQQHPVWGVYSFRWTYLASASAWQSSDGGRKCATQWWVSFFLFFLGEFSPPKMGQFHDSHFGLAQDFFFYINFSGEKKPSIARWKCQYKFGILPGYSLKPPINGDFFRTLRVPSLWLVSFFFSPRQYWHEVMKAQQLIRSGVLGDLLSVRVPRSERFRVSRCAAVKISHGISSSLRIQAPP